MTPGRSAGCAEKQRLSRDRRHRACPRRRIRRVGVRAPSRHPTEAPLGGPAEECRAVKNPSSASYATRSACARAKPHSASGTSSPASFSKYLATCRTPPVRRGTGQAGLRVRPPWWGDQTHAATRGTYLRQPRRYAPKERGTSRPCSSSPTDASTSSEPRSATVCATKSHRRWLRSLNTAAGSPRASAGSTAPPSPRHVETTRTSWSPVLRCPMPRKSRVKHSSNSTMSGSSLKYTKIASRFGRNITDATFTNRR